MMAAPCCLQVEMATKRILVIDDESNIREIVGACLQRLGGWEVHAVSSGYEGLAIAQAEHPDAIVLDVMMPGMSGLTFLERLRVNPDTQSIPVVLLTANAYLTDPQTLSQLGVKVTIPKPFEPKALVRQMADALDWDSSV
ncbi:MAG: response regulator [Thermosynechococcaceae cyanobacterium]